MWLSAKKGVGVRGDPDYPVWGRDEPLRIHVSPFIPADRDPPEADPYIARERSAYLLIVMAGALTLETSVTVIWKRL